MSIPFAQPTFLMPYPRHATVTDYRCVVNATGTRLIFERTILNSATGKTPLVQLYLLDLTMVGAQPICLLPSYGQSTRPDWSWSSGVLAYNNTQGIFTVADPTAPNPVPMVIPNTQGMIHPAWYPSGLDR